ncbi:MAG TPA: PIG-L deacetylase family protein [Actinomycetota bacterium]|nr:PIG-L deacetylase family protein [Actinomycetota bacterium]
MNLPEFSTALLVAPHPDDAEFACGGSIARWVSEGKRVILCVVANGAQGSNDPSVDRDELIRLRQEEQREAAEIAGISEVVFLGYEDGSVEDSHPLRRDIIREIRRYKPDIVVGPDPSLYYLEDFYVNHPDHRAVGEAFLAAVNPGSTTVPAYRSELYDQGFEPHQVKACLLVLAPEPNFFVDVSAYLDKKVSALKAHHSQMDSWEGLDDFITGMASRVAARSGQNLTHAEAFKLLRFDVPPGATGS